MNANDMRKPVTPGEHTARLIDELGYVASRHVMQRGPLQLDMTEGTGQIPLRIPFHDVVADLLQGAIVILCGLMKSGGMDNPKARAVREVRRLLDEMVKNMPTAELLEPAAAGIVNEIALAVGQFLVEEDLPEGMRVTGKPYGTDPKVTLISPDGHDEEAERAAAARDAEAEKKRGGS